MVGQQKHDIIIAYKKFFNIVEEYIDNLEFIIQAINIDTISYTYGAFLYNFKRDFGITIKEYYTRRRFNRICDELKKTDKRILDIAAEYGYSTQSSLNSIFNKYIGMSPLEYRNSMAVIKPYFIDINDENTQNKILGLPYKDSSTQFLSELMGVEQITTQVVNTRLFHLAQKGHDNIDELIDKIIFHYKKDKKNLDIRIQDIKVRATRLNRNEKKIYDKYIHPNISQNMNPIKINIKKIKFEMVLPYDEVIELLFSFMRHEIEIKSNVYISNIKIFTNIEIKDDFAEIKVNT